MKIFPYGLSRVSCIRYKYDGFEDNMKYRYIIAAFIVCPAFVASFAQNQDLTGAWEGPNELTMTICTDNGNRQSVCYCGIYRTIGWVDVASEIIGDSLIMTAEHADSPLEGRFRIVSQERMTGTLTTGKPGESWYFNGSAELVKQKPYMPDNLNPDLEGVIHTSDYGLLSLDREMAKEALSAVSRNSVGYADKEMVEKLLNSKTYPVTPEDLEGFRRVRSIQIDARDGIYIYPFFDCIFRKTGGKVFFEKTTGSQRKSGFLYQNSPESLIFLGGWSVNDEPQSEYGSPNSVAGTVYRIGEGRAIMIFPSETGRVEIYEFVRGTR